MCFFERQKLNLKKQFFYFCCMAGIVLLSTTTVAAVDLTVNSNTVSVPGEMVSISISMDNSTQIAAGVFTILYNTDFLQIQSVANPFFDSFETGAEIPGTGIMVSGAKPQAGASSGTLLILHFLVKSAATGDITIALSASTISNPAAGYLTPAAIPVLLGSDPARDITDPAAYPVLTASLISGVLSIDRDDDGLTDTEEGAYGTDINNPDSDGDGLPDGYEAGYYPDLDPMFDDALTDADGDGFSNLREYLAQSSPDDENDVPVELLADKFQDGDVDGIDLALLSDEFNRTDCSVTPCAFDLNDDGLVNEIDLFLFTEDFGF